MMDSKLLEKYDIPVPRYTSYPTVPYWTDSPSTSQWLESLKQTLTDNSNWSMYIHIPFCENLCTFCGCNSTITRNHDVEKKYIDTLLKEWKIYKSNVPALNKIPMKQLHFGGGTPTFLSVESLSRLMEGITDGLVNTDGKSERSLEVDPRHTSYEQLACLRKFHFNRISLGVQDFSEHVQGLINRFQSYEQTRAVTKWARDLGYTSVNFDLIYGLPDQTEEIMNFTLDKTIELRPDRIALYSFALVPWIKPAQRKFTDEQIPKGAAKRALYELSRKRLLDAGYLEIGMDHFALPEDELSLGEKTKSLHRNFMGYTPYKTDALIGLGVSAISESKDCYHQNEKIISLYEETVMNGNIPTSRGHILSDEDIHQREMILDLMTSWQVDLTNEQYEEIQGLLSPMRDDELIDLSHNKLEVRKDGRPFIRNICVAFDKRMQGNKPITKIFSQSL